MKAMDELRAALRQYVTDMSAAYVGEGAWPLEQIRARFEGDPVPYGVLEKVLLLPDPRDGMALAREALAHPNSIIVMDAAAILTVLGDSSGLAPLKERLIHRPPVTNSGFELDVIAAILALHGEPVRVPIAPNATPLRPLLLRLLPPR
jgi:hypothetical protein